MNRVETSHSSLLTSLRLSALTVVVTAGIATPPLLAQPAPCARPSVTVTTSREPVAEPEGGGGTTTVEFEIAVDVGGAEYCFWEVTYQTGGGDATPREDYRPIDRTTECRSGNDTATGSVDILGDTTSEPDETFEIQVPTILVGGCAEGERFDVDESATVTIVNYQAPSISIDDVEVEEGDEGTTNAVFTVRAEPLAPEPIAVRFQTEPDSATVSDGDFKAQFGAVTIPPAEP